MTFSPYALTFTPIERARMRQIGEAVQRNAEELGLRYYGALEYVCMRALESADFCVERCSVTSSSGANMLKTVEVDGKPFAEVWIDCSLERPHIWVRGEIIGKPEEEIIV